MNKALNYLKNIDETLEISNQYLSMLADDVNTRAREKKIEQHAKPIRSTEDILAMVADTMKTKSKEPDITIVVCPDVETAYKAVENMVEFLRRKGIKKLIQDDIRSIRYCNTAGNVFVRQYVISGESIDEAKASTIEILKGEEYILVGNEKEK